MKLAVFGGWEPDVAEITINGTRAYHRWSRLEILDQREIGKVTLERYYVGIEFGFPNKDGTTTAGGKIYYLLNDFESDSSAVKGDGDSSSIGASLFFRF